MPSLALVHHVAELVGLTADTRSAGEVAVMLGVQSSRIRQRAFRGELYGVQENGKWQFPGFQFVDGWFLDIRLGLLSTARWRCKMPKLPRPPSAETLRMSSPDTHVLAAGSTLWRLYFAAGAYPSTWYKFRQVGPLGHRFDHHLLDTSDRLRVQDRGILYAAVQGPA